MKPLNIVDLFCGCGGMSLGFENAGFNIVAAFDNWRAAVDIYKANFNHPVYEKDLNEEDVITIIKKFNPDMIIGGPPCQDFSIAGKRNLGSRANLSLRYAEIISKIKPKWFVMENVYNITKMSILPKIVDVLKNAGYGITIKILNAAKCGVPQKRQRFFMIGHLHDKDDFLDDLLTTNLSPSEMSVFDYVGDKFGINFYYMHPRSYNRRAVFSIFEPSSTIRGVNRPIPNNYKKHPADKADISDGVRCLTTKERSLIQTFPETFKFTGSKTNIEQVVGNAVPVKLAQYVAENILTYINKKTTN